ncbi:MAG: SpoIID/LytB domain-containing protein [Ruthenibacterium lactatiformans]
MKWKNLLAFPLTLGLVSILSVSVLALDTSISDVALESNSDTQPVAVIDISESQSNSLTEGTVEQNAPSETLGGEADQEKPEGNVPPEAPDGEVEQEKPEENVPSETPDGEIDQEKSEENVPSETPDGEIDQEKPEENVLPETSDEEIEQEKPEENVPSETPNGESGVDVIPEENPSQMLPDANAPQENAIVPDGWQQVNGNWYYYRNGEALKGSQTVPIDKTNTDLGATDWYFFDETGAMKTGPVPMFGGYQAYQDDGRLLHNGWAQIGGKYYYAQPNQQLSLGSVSVPVREDASIKDWYYITLDGGMQTGPVSLYGGYQCYYESGRLVYGGWVTVGGKTYYVDSINQQLSLGSVSVPVREDTSINDWYYITLDGGMQTGPIPMFGGYQAYKDDGRLLYGGWAKISGKYYYAQPNQQLSLGSVSVPVRENTSMNDWYYITLDGGMQTGPIPMFGGYQAYKDDGRLLYGGWAKISGKYYYAQPNQQLSLGSVSVPVRENTSMNDWYYITLDGGMQTGPIPMFGGYQAYKDDGRLLYGGWAQIGGKYYYAQPNQQLSLGSVYIPIRENTNISDWYYISLDKGMQTGPIPMFDGYQAYKDDGRLLYGGWAQIGGKYYYAQPNQQLSLGSVSVPVRENTSMNDWYYITLDGGMQTGPIPMFGGYQAYKDDGRLLYGGWAQIGGKYYYAQPNQQLSLGSVYIPVREDTSISDWYYITVENGMRVGSVPIYGGYQCYYESGRLVYGGWATVNGKTYYADPSNQQLKTGTAVIDNVTYIFDSTGMLISEVHKGIDVSSHQGIIDWNQVRTSGVQFAVIRIMSWQGDAATGGYAIDPDFERNIREARAAGIYVGAYWYSVAFNGSEALQEVNIIKNSVAWNNVLNDGIILDLPMFIDYENNTAWFNSQTTYASRTEAVRMGMIYTENILGCRPGFYSSESYIENWFDGKQLIAEGYDCWVANWSGSHGLGDDAAMWQYTSKGSVSGINGNVDLNYCYNSDYFDSLKVYDQGIGKNVQGNAQTILTRVVQNEVGGMNNTEVYKAQAVAANTYMRYLIGQGKIPSVKLSLMVPSSAVRNAVAQVKGETVKYNGNLALTVYGSSSAGTTNKAYTYGWVELPYLTNVDNKYDTQYKNMTCYVKNSDLEKGIKALGGSTEGYDPSNWIQGCVFDQYGWLKSITLCGKMYTAEQFYENSWGLYSTNFKSFTYDSANSRWVFTGVNGNGHGIGMSQYGAKGMADAGYNYKQILNHYYPGTVII